MADLYASNNSEVDADNNSVPPDGMPEGQNPSTVNNWARAFIGAVKRFVNQSIPKVTAGTTTAYTLSYTVAPGALYDGMTFRVQFHVANGSSATLNVNSLGATPIHYYSVGAWRVAPPNLFNVDEVFTVSYHQSSGTYRLIGFNNKTGIGEDFWGTTAPPGTLFAFGQAVSRTTYAGLFSVCGTTFGAGDGSTTFNLPDKRGRASFASDTNGDVAAGRLTGAGGLAGTLGAVGGFETHNHTQVTGTFAGTTAGTIHTTSTAINGTSVFADGGGGPATGFNHQHTVDVGNVPVSGAISGNTNSGNTIPPGIVCNYVVRI